MFIFWPRLCDRQSPSADVQVESVTDETAEQLRTIEKTGQAPSDQAVKALTQRKLVTPKYVSAPCFHIITHPCRIPPMPCCGCELTDRKHIHYSVKKGPNFATEVKQLETDLTVDMIASLVILPISTYCGPRLRLRHL